VTTGSNVILLVFREVLISVFTVGFVTATAKTNELVHTATTKAKKLRRNCFETCFFTNFFLVIKWFILRLVFDFMTLGQFIGQL
jgi:hypothetical protein